MMRNNDFSTIRTMDDILAHKEILRRSINLQEQRLQNDIKQIRASWSIFPRLFSSISTWGFMASKSMRFFLIGYQLINKLFYRKRRK